MALPNRLTLPDGSYYSFTYEPTYQIAGSVTGRLASVTLPTGGTISYSYTAGCSGAGINADGSVGSLSRTTSDGTRSYTRSPISGGTSTTVQDEKGNQTYYAFVNDANTGRFYETHRQAYQGSTGGSQLLDRYSCYNGATLNCDGQAVTLPISEADVVESYNNGSQVLTANSYDPSASLLTKSSVYSGSSANSTSL